MPIKSAGGSGEYPDFLEVLIMSASEQKKSWIPEVPKEHILELSQRIKPVMRFRRIHEVIRKNPGEKSTIIEEEHPRGELRRAELDGVGMAYYIEDPNLFDVAYTWEPKPTTRATGLRPVRDIITYHAWGYYALFKPSIAEVLAQIPAELCEQVVAFEIVDSPKTTDDLHREQEALDAGYHVATTRLYVSNKRKTTPRT